MPSAVPAKLAKQPSTTTSSDQPAASVNEQKEKDGKDGKDQPKDAVGLLESKIRNLEKRRKKLEEYERDLKKGKNLSADQREAASHLGEVEQLLLMCQEMLTSCIGYAKADEKQKKADDKAARRERAQGEISRLRDFLRFQDVLSSLGNDKIRKDFLDGENGAMKLTEEVLQKLDELYQKLCPCHEDLTEDQNWETFLNDSSLIAYSVLTNSMNTVPFYEGKTYRDFRTLLESIANCGYFDGKFGRQSPEQAKSEAASTISNPEDAARAGLDKMEEQKASANVGNLQQLGQSAYNNGGGVSGMVSAPLASSTSPPRQCSPSDLVGQGGQTNISFLQDDQSGNVYGTNAANFDASAISSSLPYQTESMPFVGGGGYPTGTAASSVMYNQQQPNMSTAQNYTLPFDPTQLHGGGQDAAMMQRTMLDPNAQPFVSQGDAIFSNSMVSASSQMHQEPNVAQYFQSTTVDERHEPIADALADGSDGFSHQRNYGGGRGRGGGYRGGERGGYNNTGRGKYGGGNYRGGQQGNWGGYEGGRGGRGGGGGYRGGSGTFRSDESGQSRRNDGGRGGGYRRDGGRGGSGGYEQRGGGGGRGAGGQPNRGANRGVEG